MVEWYSRGKLLDSRQLVGRKAGREIEKEEEEEEEGEEEEEK